MSKRVRERCSREKERERLGAKTLVESRSATDAWVIGCTHFTVKKLPPAMVSPEAGQEGLVR